MNSSLNYGTYVDDYRGYYMHLLLASELFQPNVMCYMYYVQARGDDQSGKNRDSRSLVFELTDR